MGHQTVSYAACTRDPYHSNPVNTRNGREGRTTTAFFSSPLPSPSQPRPHCAENPSVARFASPSATGGYKLSRAKDICLSLSPTLLLPRHPPPWWLCMRGPPPSSAATAALTLSKSVPGRYSWNTVAGERVRFVRNVSICPMDFTAPEEKY